MPDTNAIPDASCNGVFLASASHVQMQNGGSFVIREDGSCSGDLVCIVEFVRHRHDRKSPALFRSHDKAASLVCAADDDELRPFDSMIACEFFKLFMHRFTVFKTDDEDSSVASFRVFYGVFGSLFLRFFLLPRSFFIGVQPVDSPVEICGEKPPAKVGDE